MKRVLVLLLVITVLALGLAELCGIKRVSEDEDTVTVVASFYPVYTAALQVAQGSGGVSVHCLTPPSSGCLHDHQLSPSERVTLQKAELLLLNGGGAEEFLEPLLPQLTATVVNTSAKVLPEEACEEHEHHEHDHAHNEHVWMAPALYTEQVLAICEALCAADQANEALYRQNTARYVSEISKITEEFKTIAETLPLDAALLFHDSVRYVAETVGLTVAGELPLGEDAGFSAAQVAAAAESIRDKRVLFLYDEQYPVQMTQLTRYASHSAMVSLNCAVAPVAGVNDSDVWLWAMRKNLERLKETAV